MALSKTTLLSITLPGVQLCSESNRREHWTTRHRRAKEHRASVFYSLLAHVPRPVGQLRPLTITITRIAARMLDEGDNLPMSAKHIRDGVADWLAGAYGQGQDRQPGLHWHYAQRRGGTREYGVEITFQPGSPDEAGMQAHGAREHHATGT